MKPALLLLLVLSNYLSYSQRLVDFKLFQKQAEVDNYLRSLCKIHNNSAKRLIGQEELTEVIPLPSIKSDVYASLITVHFVYVSVIKTYVSDIMAITVEDKQVPKYLEVLNKKYQHVGDHWEYDTGKSIAGKEIYYHFQFELGPNDHTPIGYSLIRGKISLK